MRQGRCLKSGARLSSMPSFFFTTASYTFRRLQHFFAAEYLKMAIGLMKIFNMQWAWSFLSVSRNVAIVLNTFRNFFPLVRCSLRAKLVAVQTDTEWSIERLFCQRPTPSSICLHKH